MSGILKGWFINLSKYLTTQLELSNKSARTKLVNSTTQASFTMFWILPKATHSQKLGGGSALSGHIGPQINLFFCVFGLHFSPS